MKGVGGDVHCFWRVQVESVNGKATMPSTIAAEEGTGALDRSFVRIAVGETKNPAEVYSGFNISDGEVKIIVEIAPYFYKGHSTNRYLDGSVAASSKKAFGFFLVDPQITTYSGGYTFFSSIVIFTPKSGLFDEIAPEES
jgi:hypothetical protein